MAERLLLAGRDTGGGGKDGAGGREGAADGASKVAVAEMSAGGGTTAPQALQKRLPADTPAPQDEHWMSVLAKHHLRGMITRTQSETAISPGRIGRVRGSSPRTASHPMNISTPENPAIRTTS